MLHTDGLWANEFRLGGVSEYKATDLHMPRKATRAPKAATEFNWYTNITDDTFAPGQREGIPLPTKFAQTRMRTNLFDRYGQNHPYPINYEGFDFTNFITGPVAQRRGQYWWQTLADGNEELDKPGFFQNTGTWNAAPTGRTALRNIVPRSTATALTPL